MLSYYGSVGLLCALHLLRGIRDQPDYPQPQTSMESKHLELADWDIDELYSFHCMTAPRKYRALLVRTTDMGFAR